MFFSLFFYYIIPFSYGYFWSVWLVMTYFYISGHSHSPPLTHHYASYLISTFAKTMPSHMALTCECTFFYQNIVTSQCELW